MLAAHQVFESLLDEHFVEGLVHISELANFRVKQTEDIVKVGDDIWVKCLGVDEKGRVRLSRKAAIFSSAARSASCPAAAGTS